MKMNKFEKYEKNCLSKSDKKSQFLQFFISAKYEKHPSEKVDQTSQIFHVFKHICKEGGINLLHANIGYDWKFLSFVSECLKVVNCHTFS